MIDIKTQHGKTVTVESTSVTPITRVISIGLPQWLNPEKGWGFISQHPTALIVEDGQKTEIIRIHDLQKIVTGILLFITVLFVSISFLVNKKEK